MLTVPLLQASFMRLSRGYAKTDDLVRYTIPGVCQDERNQRRGDVEIEKLGSPVPRTIQQRNVTDFTLIDSGITQFVVAFAISNKTAAMHEDFS